MVNLYIRSEHNKIVHSAALQELETLNRSEVLWIDMIASDSAERKVVERYLNINLQTRQRAEEIESSSRYYEDENAQYANASFACMQPEEGLSVVQVSFAICGDVLVSLRPQELSAFNDTIRKLYINSKLYTNGFNIIVAIFESRIDIDADQLEMLAKEVSALNKISAVDNSKHLDKNLLLAINRLQESTMIMRESVVDKQRIVSSFLKSNYFPLDTMPKLTIMIKDINSLIGYADFMFERLEYLQNTVRGLISIDQNRVIKIFTVATLVFMPPTLISGIYGMNFNIIPELSWSFGYPFAIGLMLMSIIITVLVFKLKKLL
jgi:magnesium transporter